MDREGWTHPAVLYDALFMGRGVRLWLLGSFSVELDRDAKASLSPITMSVATQTPRCWIAALVLRSLCCFRSPTASPGIPILVALFNYAYFVCVEVWGGFTCHSALGEVRGLRVRLGSFPAPREFRGLHLDCQAWRHNCWGSNAIKKLLPLFEVKYMCMRGGSRCL